MLVGDLEDDIKNAGLDLGQPEQAAEQGGPHFRHGHADGVALLAEDIPEAGRIGLEPEVLAEAEARDAVLHILGHDAGLAHAGQIALDIGQEHGNAHLREALGHDLHGDGLARAGGAGDEAVAVGHLRQQIQVLVGLRKPDLVIAVHSDSP